MDERHTHARMHALVAPSTPSLLLTRANRPRRIPGPEKPNSATTGGSVLNDHRGRQSDNTTLAASPTTINKANNCPGVSISQISAPHHLRLRCLSCLVLPLFPSITALLWDLTASQHKWVAQRSFTKYRYFRTVYPLLVLDSVRALLALCVCSGARLVRVSSSVRCMVDFVSVTRRVLPVLPVMLGAARCVGAKSGIGLQESGIQRGTMGSLSIQFSYFFRSSITPVRRVLSEAGRSERPWSAARLLHLSLPCIAAAALSWRCRGVVVVGDENTPPSCPSRRSKPVLARQKLPSQRSNRAIPGANGPSLA